MTSTVWDAEYPSDAAAAEGCVPTVLVAHEPHNDAALLAAPNLAQSLEMPGAGTTRCRKEEGAVESSRKDAGLGAMRRFDLTDRMSASITEHCGEEMQRRARTAVRLP
ncbi:hypothetical protein FXB39_12400 [Nocardioides sp. BGMRC 2183]|nr:hypothetical protein FXB39_12400 [Nocardioides sp. BGMRC 2183]